MSPNDFLHLAAGCLASLQMAAGLQVPTGADNERFLAPLAANPAKAKFGSLGQTGDPAACERATRIANELSAQFRRERSSPCEILHLIVEAAAGSPGLFAACQNGPFLTFAGIGAVLVAQALGRTAKLVPTNDGRVRLVLIEGEWADIAGRGIYPVLVGSELVLDRVVEGEVAI